MENNETLLFGTPQMSLEIITEHEVSRKAKDISYDITYRHYLTTDTNEHISTERDTHRLRKQTMLI